MLGMGLQDAYEIMNELLATDKMPYKFLLMIHPVPGVQCPFLVWGASCHAPQLKEKPWRQLNFFDHPCDILAAFPPDWLSRTRRQKHPGSWVPE